MRIFYTFLKYSLFFLIVSIVFIGCEKKEQKKPEESARTQQSAPKDTAKVDSAKTAPKEALPDLTGTWKGEMSNRSTVLKITKFADNKFTGTITIAFKDPINQEVSGKYNPDNHSIVMQDLKHHRYQGSYSGKLNDELNKMSGTFTIKVDGQKFNFNLVKK